MSVGMNPKPENIACDSSDTQARLLNAAESLFIDAGYAGMSARAIAQFLFTQEMPTLRQGKFYTAMVMN